MAPVPPSLPGSSQGQPSPSTKHTLKEPNITLPDALMDESIQTGLRQMKTAISFTSESSMLLTGFRGTGKTTLAVMAASAMGRKVIDVDSAFATALGVPSNEYKATHGFAEYQKRQTLFLQNILERYQDGCILVCSWVDNQVQQLYRDFSRHHPVIHVIRGPEAIARLFNITDEAKICQMLHASRSIWRTCTNSEFFNVCEKIAPLLPTHGSVCQNGATSASLTLKNTERHLRRFLSRVYPEVSYSVLGPACPLADIPVQDRRFTYAVSLPLPAVLDEGFDLAQHAVGADAVQIVVQDFDQHLHSERVTPLPLELEFDIARAIGKARRSTSLPLIIHLVLSDANNEHAVKIYVELLHQCLRLGPDIMTVDLRLDDNRICDLIASRHQTMLMGSHSSETPLPWDSPVWFAQYTKANRLGLHFARFVCPPLSMEDSSNVIRLRCRVAEMKDAKTRLIAYNSGILGRLSAVFNCSLTEVRSGVLDYQKMSPRPSPAPSVTAFEATRALFSSFTNTALKFYVLGRDVDYSLSPAMLISAFKACGIPHQYRPWSTPTLQDVKILMDDDLFGGATVTTPFKIEALDLTQSLSKHARAIGAINTLIPLRGLEKDGSLPTGARLFHQINQPGPIKALHGENTDWVGIGACIQRGLSPANAITPDTCGLILGAGGMARAALYAMLRLGIRNIVIYNRTVTNAERVVSHFTKIAQQKDFEASGNMKKVRFFILTKPGQPWPKEFRFPVVIVSCIPVVVPTDLSALPFVLPNEYFSAPTGGVALDVGYKIPDTPLVVQARKNAGQGWVIMHGLDFLPQQGFAQFELFTGRRAPRRIMEEEVDRISFR